MLKNKEKNVGHVIKILRTAAGFKQKNLAEKVGIKGNYLSMIEAGKRDPSINLLRSIAKTLDVPVSFLFWEHKGQLETNNVKENKILKEIKHLLLEVEQLRLSNNSIKTK